MFDVVMLSRMQFAMTSIFHFMYPPLSIGLGLFLVLIEGVYLKTKDPRFLKMAKFWTKIFALTFAFGVATGLVQLFGFGTNWSRYSRFVGDVFGSALGAEGIFAFFLEAGFIGLMLFGWNRVRPGIHYFSTIMVTFGAHFSAVWIIAANSWMQTPAGFRIEGTGESARAVVTDFWQMIFNPSFLDRITHTTIACWITGIFLVISITAYYYLKKQHMAFARTTMKVSIPIACVLLLMQLVSADSTARGVAKNQPPKLAAIEGVYETRERTPMTLIGWVDTKEQKVVGIQVPALLSFLVYRNTTEAVPGLNTVPPSDWPPVAVIFQTYHMMIYMWFAMALAAFLGLLQLWRKKLETSKWLLRLMVLSVAFPQIANITGWMTAEIGRQPWVVWGLLRTSRGVSPGLVAGEVLASLIILFTIYISLLATFLFILDRKIKHGPDEAADETPVYQNIPGGNP